MSISIEPVLFPGIKALFNVKYNKCTKFSFLAHSVKWVRLEKFGLSSVSKKVQPVVHVILISCFFDNVKSLNNKTELLR